MKLPIGWRADSRAKKPRRMSPGRPRLECLEQRLVLSGDALFAALKTHYWIDYAPSYSSPSQNYDPNPTDQHIRSDLTTLYQEGFRGLVTYTVLGTYSHIPQIAKSVGFQYVIAGVYYPTNSEEMAAALSPGVADYTDGYVVGNEGLDQPAQSGGYTLAQLKSAIAQVQQSTGKPVTTSEPGGQYFPGAPHASDLVKLGDWLFPNLDYFLWDTPSPTHSRSPADMWVDVRYAYDQLTTTLNQTTGPVIVKEAFFPTANQPSSDPDPNASQANQVSWYGSEAYVHPGLAEPFYYVWGEAFDQPWKHGVIQNGRDYEPYMGLHSLNNPDGSANPKAIISQLT